MDLSGDDGLELSVRKVLDIDYFTNDHLSWIKKWSEFHDEMEPHVGHFKCTDKLSNVSEDGEQQRKKVKATDD